MAELRKTPLNDVHRESGARMVPFGGWDMPVEYSGLIAEHTAVRTAERDEFLATETDHAPTAVAGLDLDRGFVDELHAEGDWG